MVEQKNKTRFAREMRDAFEHALNYIATESDSEWDQATKCLKTAEVWSFPTHYERALMLALFKMLSDINQIADYEIGK